MFKGPGKIVRDNKSSSYPVFELTGVNCISESPQKNDSIFLKEILTQWLFKISLWHEIDNTTSNFLISSKTFSKIIGERVTLLWKI